MTNRAQKVKLNSVELDRMNLDQALRDFEVSNARVLDLTQRLIDSERRRREVEAEVETLRSRLDEVASHGNGADRPTAEPTPFAERVARWTLRRAKTAAKTLLRRPS